MNIDFAGPEAKLSTRVICSFLLRIMWGLFFYDLLQDRLYHPLFTGGKIDERGRLGKTLLALSG